ncbi:hypothetical protein [Paraburkholderia caledonica]|uniref:Uncharacterized protein n=1 Tax=Paraburkholderia caledonica TaxID=134536 RepID=A0AB73IPT1_9BURK|nr:hypothetical protein [Paraburkholderia caledonica]
MPNAKAWAGQIAEQFGDRIPAQYLEGSGRQLVIDLADLSEDITNAGKTVKETGFPLSQESGESILISIQPTGRTWRTSMDIASFLTTSAVPPKLGGLLATKSRLS